LCDLVLELGFQGMEVKEVAVIRRTKGERTPPGASESAKVVDQSLNIRFLNNKIPCA